MLQVSMSAGFKRYQYWHAESPELCKVVKRGDYAAARGQSLRVTTLLNVNLIPFFFLTGHSQLLPEKTSWFSTLGEIRWLSHQASKGITTKSGYRGSSFVWVLTVNRDWRSVPKKHQRTLLWSWYRFTWLPCQTTSWELIKYFNRNPKRPPWD